LLKRILSKKKKIVFWISNLPDFDFFLRVEFTDEHFLRSIRSGIVAIKRTLFGFLCLTKKQQLVAKHRSHNNMCEYKEEKSLTESRKNCSSEEKDQINTSVFCYRIGVFYLKERA
jgi:hypothetical protein